MVKEKKKKRKTPKKSAKKQIKKRSKLSHKAENKEEQSNDIIFDSTIGKTDSLFVENLNQEKQKSIAEFAFLNKEDSIIQPQNFNLTEEKKDEKVKKWWERIKIFKKFFVILLFVNLIIFPVIVFAGTINSEQKYAWSDQLGWINFGCNSCNINVTNSGITGYAWSENYGWINFNPEGGGVLMSPNGSGVLSGYAWGENTGWIDFSGVTIDSNGKFNGAASLDYSVFDCQNTGEPCQIVFSCEENGVNRCLVSTDWRQSANWIPSSSVNTGGGFSSISTSQSKFLINDGAARTNNSVVTLSFEKINPDIVGVVISLNPDFLGASYQVFEKTKKFVLPKGDGSKTIYVKFLDKNGKLSDVFSASIVLYTKLPDLSVNKLKDFYSSNEYIIISGTSIPNASILLGWDEKYGLVNADQNGKWIANLGKLPAGSYSLTITARDDIGNTKITSTSILVKASAEGDKQDDSEKIKIPLLKNIREKIDSLINPLASKKKAVLPVVTISKKTPEPFKYKWNLLPVKAQQPIIY